MNILVLHPGALGDIILSLPAMELLRGRFRSARITLAGNLDYLTAVARSHADRLISLSTLPLHSLHQADSLQPLQDSFWAEFDLILSWTGSGDPGFVQRFRSLHPNAHIASWKPLPGTKTHASRRFLESLALWAEMPSWVRPAEILLAPENRADARDWLRAQGWVGSERLVALHPGAGSEGKRWPISKYRELAGRLAASAGNKLLIIEGPAEPGLGGELAQSFPAESCVMARNIPLGVLAGLLELCAVFVGNDSGIAHFSAALKTRTLVLFGPTWPENWAPLGENSVTLRHAENCAACREGLTGAHHTCLGDIPVAGVMEQLHKWEIG